MESCVNKCVDDHGDITPPLCIETAALAPSARDGLTPTEICIRDFLEMNALTPYVCERGAGYACCTNDVESVHQAGLGECAKDLKITEKVDKNDASSEDNSRRENENRFHPKIEEKYFPADTESKIERDSPPLLLLNESILFP